MSFRKDDEEAIRKWFNENVQLDPIKPDNTRETLELLGRRRRECLEALYDAIEDKVDPDILIESIDQYRRSNELYRSLLDVLLSARD